MIFYSKGSKHQRNESNSVYLNQLPFLGITVEIFLNSDSITFRKFLHFRVNSILFSYWVGTLAKRSIASVLNWNFLLNLECFCKWKSFSVPKLQNVPKKACSLSVFVFTFFCSPVFSYNYDKILLDQMSLKTAVLSSSH